MTTTPPDAALLADAKRWMGKLPRDQFDLLLALIADARKGGHVAGFRAGQSHADAGLLAALEAVRRQIAQQRGGALYPNDADGFEMALDDIDEAARAAIAAAKKAGGRDAR